MAWDKRPTSQRSNRPRRCPGARVHHRLQGWLRDRDWRARRHAFGWQRQRIAIARALLTDPRILILDDSTSAIDSATEDEIQKAIRRVLQGVPRC